jgi:uncharacterized membrane protein YdjX (TVP38/TMEM64 family)
MPVDPALGPGLRAYDAGDFVAALVAWEAPWQRLRGDERALCLALVRIAGALHHRRAGRETSARRLREAALATLDPLPQDVLGVDVFHLTGTLRDGLDVPPEIRPWRRVALATKIRFAAFVLFLAAVALAFRLTPLGRLLEKELAINLLEQLRDAWWAPLAHVAAFAVAAPMGLPISPLVLAGGAVFGLAKGSMFNAMGTILGSAVSYLLARALGRDFVRGVVGDRLDRVETFVRRHGFWSLVGIRFMPIPFPVVNFGQALAGVPWTTFILTSTLGLIPSALVYTYLATALWEVAREKDPGAALGLLFAMLLVGFLGFAPTLYRLWERRRRYRRLLARRARRRSP